MDPDVSRMIVELDEAIAVAASCLPAGVEAAARAGLDDAVRRYEQAGEHTVVALVGGTGSGKSSLFNALTDSDFADDGVLRPTTRRASSCTWGSDAESLLDFLGVDPARRLERAADGAASGLVLLDLPDNDSVEEAHLKQVEQLLPVVDVLAWVVDPQKYADHLLHANYLQVLGRRADAMVVIVNQIDTLTPAGLETILADVRRLLIEDGLPDVDVLTTCAVSGQGVDTLWQRLTSVAAGESTARRTIAAELGQIATRVLSHMGKSEASVDDAVIDEAVSELLAASGVEAVSDAIASGRGAVMRPQAPGRAAVAAIGSSWAAQATEGLPSPWADAVEAELPSVRQLQESTARALAAVPVPTPRKGPHIGLVVAGALLAVIAVGMGVLAAIGATNPDFGLGGAPRIVLVLGACALLVAAAFALIRAPQQAQEARTTAAAAYNESVRSQVRDEVRDVLVLPTAEVLARHARSRELLESAAR